jgi:hypothetical protein
MANAASALASGGGSEGKTTLRIDSVRRWFGAAVASPRKRRARGQDDEEIAAALKIKKKYVPVLVHRGIASKGSGLVISACSELSVRSCKALDFDLIKSGSHFPPVAREAQKSDNQF